MITVEQRIRSLCNQQNQTLAAVCRECDINYGTLHSQLNHGREIPFSTIDKLSRVFNVPVDYFSTYRANLSINSTAGQSLLHERAAAAYTAALQSEQIELMRQGYEIGTDQVLDWLASQGSILTNFDALQEKVDIFYPIESDDTLMRPARIGRESLATLKFGLENENHYTHVVSGFDRTLIKNVMQAHTKASKMQYMVTDEAVDVVISGHRVRHTYRRIVAPVRDLQGNKFTLVHAKTI